MIEFEATLPGDIAFRSEGEPEWMPSAAEVARARTQMEREGVVGSMTRSVAPQLVPPGETPWLWLATAAALVIIWPALIAYRLVSGQPAWLPWWLPFILALANLALLAGPVLFSERTSGTDDLRKRFTRIQTIPQMLALEPAEFEVWSGMLFQLLGYRVTEHATGRRSRHRSAGLRAGGALRCRAVQTLSRHRGRADRARSVRHADAREQRSRLAGHHRRHLPPGA